MGGGATSCTPLLFQLSPILFYSSQAPLGPFSSRIFFFRGVLGGRNHPLGRGGPKLKEKKVSILGHFIPPNLVLKWACFRIQSLSSFLYSLKVLLHSPPFFFLLFSGGWGYFLHPPLIPIEPFIFAFTPGGRLNLFTFTLLGG